MSGMVELTLTMMEKYQYTEVINEEGRSIGGRLDTVTTTPHHIPRNQNLCLRAPLVGFDFGSESPACMTPLYSREHTQVDKRAGRLNFWTHSGGAL